MKKLILTLLTIAFVALAGGRASAQQVQPKIAPEKEALIKELLVLTGSAKTARDVADVMLKIQQAEMEKTTDSIIGEDSGLAASERAELNKSINESIARTTQRVTEFFKTGLDLEKVIEEITIPIYDRHFTEAELRDFVAFYKTPAGKKSISLMPQLMMETMATFSEKVSPKLMEFLKKVTDDELATLKQKLDEIKKPAPQPK